MPEAREIILIAITSALRNVPGYESLGWEPETVREGVADDAYVAIKNSLTAAGFRLLSPGQIDPETRERCKHIVDVDCPRHVGERWRKDEAPSKNDKCVHGLPMYEDCVECVSAAIRSLGEGT